MRPRELLTGSSSSFLSGSLLELQFTPCLSVTPLGLDRSISGDCRMGYLQKALCRSSQQKGYSALGSVQ